MQLQITQDILSITELKKHTNTILQQVHETKRPVVLTVNGKAEAVLLDASEFEKMSIAFDLIQKLSKAEMDIKTGKTEDADTFFKRFRSEKKNIKLRSRNLLKTILKISGNTLLWIISKLQRNF